MDYEQLTKLECSCGSRRSHVEAAVSRDNNNLLHVSSVLCEEWCAFRNRPITGGDVTPTDCELCRSTLVDEGRIVCECGQSWRIHQGRPEFGDRPVSQASKEHLRVVETDFCNDPRWNWFVREHPQGSIYHHSLWLRTLKEELGQNTLSLACVDQKGDFQGILPLFYTRGLPFGVGQHMTGRRLSSLPRTPLGGPVSAKAEATAPLLRAALEKSKAEPALRLEIKTQLQLQTDLVDGLVCTTWRPTYALEIPNRPEDLNFGDARNRHNIKWAVKKATKQGLQLRAAESESELRAWYRLYLETMRRNVVPPRPLRLFEAMWKNLAPHGLMRLQLAEQDAGGRRRLVAGSVFLTFGETVWYAFTGVGDADLSLHSNDLILWDSINNACGTGARWFDFGEVAEEHPELVRFKTKWGAQPRDQYRYYSEERNERDSARSRRYTTKYFRTVWQHLPLKMTAQLGDWIYGRL